MNYEQLTGRATGHLVHLDSIGQSIHGEVARAFSKLKEEALVAGIDLRSCSSFRSYERQEKIWNAKWAGVGKVLSQGSSDERLAAILSWSAIPGASRHHWGTDLDVFDAAAVPADYKLRLEPSEYLEGGVFEHLTRWLNTHMIEHQFFRPYDKNRGGVNPEPWHISYAPVSRKLEKAYTLEVFEKNLEQSRFSQSDRVLAKSDYFYTKYVTNVNRES